eukprot:scaffold117224_cov30-Phaeocystis_antarctica.AAC.1
MPPRKREDEENTLRVCPNRQAKCRTAPRVSAVCVKRELCVHSSYSSWLFLNKGVSKYVDREPFGTGSASQPSALAGSSRRVFKGEVEDRALGPSLRVAPVLEPLAPG